MFELDIRIKGVSQVRARFSKRLYLTYFCILEAVSLKKLPNFAYFNQVYSHPKVEGEKTYLK